MASLLLDILQRFRLRSRKRNAFSSVLSRYSLWFQAGRRALLVSYVIFITVARKHRRKEKATKPTPQSRALTTFYADPMMPHATHARTPQPRLCVRGWADLRDSQIRLVRKGRWVEQRGDVVTLEHGKSARIGCGSIKRLRAQRAPVVPSGSSLLLLHREPGDLGGQTSLLSVSS